MNVCEELRRRVSVYSGHAQRSKCTDIYEIFKIKTVLSFKMWIQSKLHRVISHHSNNSDVIHFNSAVFSVPITSSSSVFLSPSIFYQSSPEVEVTLDKAGGPHTPSQSLPVPLGPMDTTLPPPPVMEAGEAGPPGKMTATSKLPKGVDGSIMPVKGFAGAPGKELTVLKNFSLRIRINL